MLDRGLGAAVRERCAVTVAVLLRSGAYPLFEFCEDREETERLRCRGVFDCWQKRFQSHDTHVCIPDLLLTVAFSTSGGFEASSPHRPRS